MKALRIATDAVVTHRVLRSMCSVIEAALEIWPRTIDNCVWITSGYREGNKKLHGKHDAIDFRVWNILRWKEMKELVRKDLVDRIGGELRSRISDDYDVVSHPELVQTLPHIHCELDPKEWRHAAKTTRAILVKSHEQEGE